jgi:hypothetical protein
MYCSRVHNQTLHPPVHAACRRSDVGLHTHQQTLRSIIKLATRQCMPREVTVTYGNRILRHHELLELALSPKYTFHFYNDSDTRAFVAEQCPDYLDAYDCVLPGGNKTHKLNLSFRSMRASASIVTTPLLINAFSTFVSYANVKQVVTHSTLHASTFLFCLFAPLAFHHHLFLRSFQIGHFSVLRAAHAWGAVPRQRHCAAGAPRRILQ